MRRKHTVVLFIFWIGVANLYGNAKPDSLFTIEIDSQKYILHQVEKGESLFALAIRYGTTVEQLLISNEQIVDTSLAIGQLLKVTVGLHPPLNGRQKLIIRIPGAIYHEVDSMETIYGITKLYDIVQDSLMKWNHLAGNAISIGQPLIVGWQQVADSIKDSDTMISKDSLAILPQTDSFSVTIDTYFLSVTAMDSIVQLEQKVTALGRLFDEQRDSTFIEVNEKGAASWVRGNISFSSNNLFALHKHAPRGKIIKVINTMNDNFVYVKVIGKLPDIPAHKKSLLSLSYAAAKYLGVLDQLFLVRVNYYMEGEE